MKDILFFYSSHDVCFIKCFRVYISWEKEHYKDVKKLTTKEYCKVSEKITIVCMSVLK